MTAMRRNTKPPLKQVTPRPNFLAPPVIEVALAVQFDALPELGAAETGALWSRYRKEYPETEDQPPIPQATESFDPPRPKAVKFKVVQGVPETRCWFKNRTGTELIQVQKDRFVFNWRQHGSEESYPRYEQVRAKFATHFRTFELFLKGRQLGRVVPNQCTVTYVNNIMPDKNWKRFGQLKNIFSVWSGRHSDKFLGEPEEVEFRARYRILGDDGSPIGRLHVDAEPRFKSDDGSPVIHLTLTARGKPLGDGLGGILTFFDIGREHVVRGFTSITTKSLHDKWERTDAC